MSRNYFEEALIVSAAPLGENNRNICFFTAEDGISYAVLYGGPKSKMRSLVSSWNRGMLYLYKDEIRKSIKITDFDVKNFHTTFRESLFKSWAASLSVEMLIKTKCAGCSKESWTLLNGFLDGLDICGEPAGRLGLIRYLWRYIGLLGVRPDTETCVHCGGPLIAGNSEDNTVSYSGPESAFSIAENGFLCGDCAQLNPAGIIPVNGRAIRYLSATARQEPGIVRSMQIDTVSVHEMKQLVFLLAEASACTKLKSLESGIGIL
jgi:DNA repair protein RecO (recombination protein O)